MNRYGFFRVATCSPTLKVADTRHNVTEMISILTSLQRDSVDLAVFPELSVTGYTCHDLFHQDCLINAAMSSLATLVEYSRQHFNGLIVVGSPLRSEHLLFNAGIVIQKGQVLGAVPKSYLPNYKEFYESRYFAPADAAYRPTVAFLGQDIPFGTDILFKHSHLTNCILGIEICEDLWTPIPPSSYQAISGATILANLTASNELVGKSSYRKQLVLNQSARCIAAYVYAGAGPHESTTDLVFGGHSIIAENGTLIAETSKFELSSQWCIADIDLDRLIHDRVNTTSFHRNGTYNQHPTSFRNVYFTTQSPATGNLFRTVESTPFVPADPATLHQRSEEILKIQTTALARRLSTIGIPRVSIGVSGGLDSTLALIVAARSMDLLQQPRTKILGITMPGFGTTPRTKRNADILMSELGILHKTIDIRASCLEQFVSLNHHPFGINPVGLDVEEFSQLLMNLPPENRSDLVFENVQARVRTSLLMNSGFVIGTGDLSELALGWCTYNADHMSMYNPNVSIPKTLVKFLIHWAARNIFSGKVQECLLDIVDTEISPELLPTNPRGEITQSTESTIGPYELHDFFLYHILRYGTSPAKILFLSRFAKFSRPYSSDLILKWLKVFLSRFFSSQYKRSCLPDGPKVGSVSLSPRGDWRMPSDASASDWLAELENDDV